MKFTTQNNVTEWSYTAGKPYADPYNAVELDVIFTDPHGAERRVPAFWAGGQTWTVRYASPLTGTHRYRTVCSDAGNGDLHRQEGTLEVLPYEGKNPLLQHGPLRMAADRRHLQHQDGTPFFWLGDTWWMGFTKRLSWPDDVRELAADRVAKGFTLIQIVAGLYPDMEPFDPRGANEAGFPWKEDFSAINPAYFDMADLRIAHIVRSGLVPCIVGEWGYFLDFAGDEVLRKHWRNIIARYAAYPVVWCVAGEALMRYYLKPLSPAEVETWTQKQRARWSALTRYIRATDPFGRPVTIHPTDYGHNQVDDPSLLDVDMLQTGHSGFVSLSNTVDMVEKALAHEPKLPVLVGEANYEGIMDLSHNDIERFLFWTAMLSGAMGHTYGANGLWQVNTREQPYGKSPHGTSWGNLPWDDAYRLPGSRHLGLGKRLLERYEWWRLEPHHDWITPHQTPEHRIAAYAATIPGRAVICYLPGGDYVVYSNTMTVQTPNPARPQRAYYYDPRTADEVDLGTIQTDAAGKFRITQPPLFQDWVLVVETIE